MSKNKNVFKTTTKSISSYDVASVDINQGHTCVYNITLKVYEHLSWFYLNITAIFTDDHYLRKTQNDYHIKVEYTYKKFISDTFVTYMLITTWIYYYTKIIAVATKYKSYLQDMCKWNGFVRIKYHIIYISKYLISDNSFKCIL